MEVALEVEVLGVSVHPSQQADEFYDHCTTGLIVNAERPEIVRQDAEDEPHFETSVDHLVGEGNFFDQPQRMIQRYDVPHRTQSDLAGADGGSDRVQVKRRHPALIRSEMMLDAKAVIKAEFVSHLQLAPQLLVALRRGHASLIPHMGKMRKFHNDMASFL